MAAWGKKAHLQALSRLALPLASRSRGKKIICSGVFPSPLFFFLCQLRSSCPSAPVATWGSLWAVGAGERAVGEGQRAVLGSAEQAASWARDRRP